MSKKQYKPTKPKVSKATKRRAAEEVDPFFAVVAKVYGVPVNGISAIDGQPYLNKDGRLYLLDDICTGKRSVKAIRTEYIRVSTTAIEPSVAKKTIVFADKEVEATGEASQDSVNSKSVKHTLNMVAETRALNRAIWVAIGADVMKRVTKNLANMDVSDEDRARLTEAGRVSYEEMERPTETQAKETKSESDKRYEAWAKRLDQVSNDEAALRRGLLNLNKKNNGLTAEQKVLIRQRIEAALGKLKGKMKPGPKVGKKKAVKKKK